MVGGFEIHRISHSYCFSRVDCQESHNPVALDEFTLVPLRVEWLGTTMKAPLEAQALTQGPKPNANLHGKVH